MEKISGSGEEDWLYTLSKMDLNLQHPVLHDGEGQAEECREEVDMAEVNALRCIKGGGGRSCMLEQEECFASSLLRNGDSEYFSPGTYRFDSSCLSYSCRPKLSSLPVSLSAKVYPLRASQMDCCHAVTVQQEPSALFLWQRQPYWGLAGESTSYCDSGEGLAC